MYFSRANREVFMSALMLEKLGSFAIIEDVLSEVEPETKAVMKMGHTPENAQTVESRMIDAVADLSACYGIKVYNFLSKLCEAWIWKGRTC